VDSKFISSKVQQLSSTTTNNFDTYTSMQHTEFRLQGEYIQLDALLKTLGLASSGGEAKAMVAAGQVKVDGQQELRKRCKIRVGQVVTVNVATIHVIAP
jgi:ribosome-associated protein